MQLSASSLSVFKDCKRCFYLDKKMKAPRPRGIFSSLPGGIDGLLKKRLDEYRGRLSPDLEDLRIEAALINRLEKLQNGEVPKNEKSKIKRNQEIENLRKQIKGHDITKLSALKTPIRRKALSNFYPTI